MQGKASNKQEIEILENKNGIWAARRNQEQQIETHKDMDGGRAKYSGKKYSVIYDYVMLICNFFIIFVYEYYVDSNMK